jgi:cell cycle protein kinase DBF2
MASFMASLFSSSTRQDKPDGAVHRPTTPANPIQAAPSFTTPVRTPQGSPSKKTAPPGANDLPDYFDNIKLNSPTIGSEGWKTGNPFDAPPVKLAPPTPKGKINNNNIQIFEDHPTGGADESIIQKPAPAAAPRKQAQENTPPVSSRPPIVGHDSTASVLQPSHAAISRSELYHLREREKPSTPIKKFNTNRGLTAEERELLAKPNVKRMVNVTQLCKNTRIPYYDAI